MKVRRKKYEEISPLDFLLLREELGFRKYRKQVERNPDERKILLELSLRKIEEKEKNDFIPIGYRRRIIKIL